MAFLAPVGVALARPLVKWAIIGGLFVACAVAITILWLMLDNAKLEKANALHDLAIATDANAGLAKDIDNLMLLRQMDAVATAKSAERQTKLTTDIDRLKKEMRNVQGAADPAGPYRDELARRLRAIDAAHNQDGD